MQDLENAIQLIESGQTNEAIKLLDQAAETAANEDVLYTISTIYFEYDFLEKSAEILKILLDRYPGDDELILRLSEIYIELKKDDQAIELLSQIDQASDYYLPTLLQLADLYQTLGLYEVSEEKLLEAKALAPDEMVIDFALAEFLFSIGQEGRAIPFYNTVARQTEVINDVSINERLAESYGSIGSYELALNYYQKTNTENVDALFKYGYIAAQQNELELAINVWEKLLTLDIDYFSVYPELTRTYMEFGDHENAIKIAKQGIKQDEFNQELYFLLAKLSQTLQKDADVLKYIQNAIQLDEENKAVNLFLIQWYSTHDNYEAIIDFILYLFDKDIVDANYDWELAKAYEAVEDFDKALKAFERAYPSLQHDADFLKHYGYFLVEEARLDAAIEVLGQYLVIEPTDEEVIQFIERLKDSNSL